MSILRLIVILANAGFLIFVIWMVVTEGGLSDGEAVVILGLLLLFILNIYFIATSKRDGDNSWLTLFLKRKALEEKRKITELEK